MLAINGSVVPVKNGIPILIQIANSMEATSITGSASDLKVIAIIRKIAATDKIFTILKSISVVVIKSRKSVILWRNYREFIPSFPMRV